MGWSTRELAELAGTTLRTVRHYHDLGLLPQPERRANGYKQYGVDHLVRLLRIKRLTELGMPLRQIAAEHDLIDHPHEVLAEVVEEVEASIERLTGIRAELRMILDSSASVDLPPVLAAAAATGPVSTADEKLLVLLGRLMSPQTLASLAEIVDGAETPQADLDFEALDPDADEAYREDLAVRMLPVSLAMHRRMPEWVELKRVDAHGRHTPAYDALWASIVELYSPAQVDVLRRLERLRNEQLG
jgi:DNA-binding transcriptional MerR regulator